MFDLLESYENRPVTVNKDPLPPRTLLTKPNLMGSSNSFREKHLQADKWCTWFPHYILISNITDYQFTKFSYFCRNDTVLLNRPEAHTEHTGQACSSLTITAQPVNMWLCKDMPVAGRMLWIKYRNEDLLIWLKSNRQNHEVTCHPSS